MQEVGGRRQKVGGRRQKAGGRRQKAGGRRQEVVPMKKFFHHQIMKVASSEVACSLLSSQEGIKVVQ